METPRTIAVVTGSRADFGLLTPVIEAMREHPDLEPLVIAAGAHLIQPALTFREVKRLFPVADSIPMQTVGRVGRWHDVEATGRGVARFGRSFERLGPACVMVLGDRIEALAAAAAASIGGIPVAHIHGGDRAEGVADEAMRHAITKLAHIHFPATKLSKERIIRMGERPEHAFNVGSPALDGLSDVEAMSDAECDELFGAGFRPTQVVAHHPCGLDAEHERACIEDILDLCANGDHTVFIAPNFDPGREVIEDAIIGFVSEVEAGDHAKRGLQPFGCRQIMPGTRAVIVDHLPRPVFLRLLKRVAGGIGLIGNSSAALIEAAALGVIAYNYGPRQAGREKPPTVMTVGEDPATWTGQSVGDQLYALRDDALDGLAEGDAGADAGPDCTQRLAILERTGHPYRNGNGRASRQIAKILARRDLFTPELVRKRNTY